MMAIATSFCVLATLLCFLQNGAYASYSLDYRGFDRCGLGGWHCTNNLTDYMVTYRCSDSNPEVRLWVWTARIPSRTTILGVADCRHVELHMDCTTGYRAYSLKEFRVTNVDALEILAPLRPGVFLHDNDAVAHAPPQIVFSHVSNLRWADHSFDRAVGRCNTKQQVLKRISFQNVHLPVINPGSFSNLSLEEFEMSTVQVDTIETKSLTVSATVIIIINCSLPEIAPEAVQFEADNVIFQENKISNIKSSGIRVSAHSFTFSKNEVLEVKEYGFNVLARLANFSGNFWNKLGSHAFVGVAPGGKITSSYVLAEKYVFQFNDNIVKVLMENSLQPNYHVYKRICSEIIVERNSLPCSCRLPFESSGGNRTENWWHHFYGELVLTESNKCTDAPNCSLQQTLKVLQHQSCTDDWQAQTACANVTATYYTPTDEPTESSTQPEIIITTRLAPVSTTSIINIDGESPPIKDKVSSGATSNAMMVAIIVVVVGVTVASFVVIIIYIKRRQRAREINACYQYQNRVGVTAEDDYENLIRE